MFFSNCVIGNPEFLVFSFSSASLSEVSALVLWFLGTLGHVCLADFLSNAGPSLLFRSWHYDLCFKGCTQELLHKHIISVATSRDFLLMPISGKQWKATRCCVVLIHYHNIICGTHVSLSHHQTASLSVRQIITSKCLHTGQVVLKYHFNAIFILK